MESLFLFLLFVIVVSTVLNTILIIGISMLLTRLYEFVQSENNKINSKEADKRNATGLVDVTTRQFQF